MTPPDPHDRRPEEQHDLNGEMERIESAAEEFISEHDPDRAINEQSVVAAVLSGRAARKLFAMEVLPPAAKWYVIHYCVSEILQGMAEAAVADGERYKGAADGSLIFRGEDPAEVRERGKKLIDDLARKADEALCDVSNDEQAEQHIDEMERRTEELEAENERLREDLREAYRLVDTYFADMTEEASDDLERHFIEALDQAEEPQK